MLGKSVRADLAHADAVSPTAADESELRHSSRLVVFAIDHEKLFAQAEYGTDASATHVRGAVRAYDLEVCSAMRRAARDHAQVRHWPNTARRASQPRLDLAHAHRPGPVRERRKSIRGSAVRSRLNFQVINLPVKRDVISDGFAADEGHG